MNLLARRFPTILGILLLILGAGLTWWYLVKNKPQISSSITPNKVRITNVADNKFTVSWTTKQESSGWIEYGKVGEKLTNLAYDDRDSKGNAQSYVTHHITVVDLQPQTQYAFRLVGEQGKVRFDNNGNPYSVTTGPTIAEPPASKSLYGEVVGTNGKSVSGTIVYLALPGAAPASTIVTSSSNYSFTLSTVRTSDLQQYIQYDEKATVANLTVENGLTESVVTVTTENAAPVPKITLGQNADYRSTQPQVAQVEPQSSASPVGSASASTTPVTPGIFNVQPMEGSENRTGQSEVVILNPETEGEKVATTRPEFRGTGPKQTVLSITVHSSTPYSGSVTVNADGTWDWTPPKDLAEGEHTVTIAYIDAKGIEQTLTRTFVVSKALAAEGDPSFVATPSASVKTVSPTPKASVKASPTSSSTASSSATGREIIPSTESGVPVTGITAPTLLTAAVGTVIMILGALMLAL